MNVPARCAIYARYSSEKQNSLTIDQQVRKCREYAERQRWCVLPGRVYSDHAISGATDDRAGLRRLMSLALEKPRPFDVILVDDTSRLSRKLVDSLRIFEQLQFAGVRVIFVAQGIDTSSEQAEVLIATHGIVDSLYLKDLAKRTFRGVEERAIKGLHTGGRVFGYRRVPIEHPIERDSHGRPVITGVKLKVDPGQAAVVRRIFERYVRGHSLKRIAMDLNAERVASPQPQKGRVSQSWCPSSVRHILHNERYRGLVIWGRHHKIRSPKTGKRIYEWRPANEWRRTEVSEQRIVSEELWNAVRDRMRLVQRLYRVDVLRPGILRARAVGSPYLFTGLLKCSLCGANITIVSGRWKKRQDSRYGCPMHAYRGDGVCKNSLLIAQRILEEQLLAGLQEKVLHPNVIEYTIRGFEEALAREAKCQDDQMDHLRRRKTEIEKQIRNLTAAVADSGHSPSILADIAGRERELAELSEKLAEAQPETVKLRTRDAKSFVEARLRNLRGLLNGDPLRARAEIAKHLEKITLTPEGEAYVASGSWDLLGLGSMDGAGGQNRTGYARLFRAALYQ